MRRFTLMAVMLFMTLCFNSSQAWSLDRFVDLNDGTVLDTSSSLRWLKNANCDSEQNWYGAMSSAANLSSPSCGLTDGSIAGDWHLPTIDELRIFTDAGYRDDTLNAAGFTNVQAVYYWSSSTYAYSADYAWIVGMYYGYVYNVNKYDGYYVWPVRGGQYWSLDSLVMAGSREFGNLPVGSVSLPHQFTLKNSAATSSLISSIALGGTDTSQFTLTTGGTSPCSSLTSLTLAAGASCTLLVSAKPTTVGSKSANLIVTSGGSSMNALLTAISIPLTVTYNGNGSTSGAVPADSTAYTLHAPVTVLDNNGGLVKSGYTFSGWNTAADGSGVSYQPGTSFAINADTVLYARWATTSQTGLVSWWRAEANALDTSGGLVGTAASGMTYTSGKVGQAFSFSGVFGDVSPAFVTVPDNPRLNFGTDEFSIAVWIKTTVAGSYKRIATKRITNGATAWYSLAAHNGKILFETGVNNITSVATVTDGLWHHVAVTRDPASSSPRKFHLYIDGVEDASVADSGANLDNACPLELGKWFNENYYTGIYSDQIDELQFFNRALAAAEVQYIYNAGSAGLALTPTVTGISPARGLATGGSQVVISGTSLSKANAVKFGTTSAAGFIVVSDTQITAIVPAGNVATIADITVTTPGGTSAGSSSSQFTYTGLVSWWKAEGNALDAVGDLNGTVGLYSYYYLGKIGQAFVFTGSPTGYVTVPDNQKLSFGVDEFSLAVWVKTSDNGTWKRIVTKRPASGATAWYSLVVFGNKAIFEISADVSLTSSIPVADDAWHHIAVIRDPVGSSPRKYRLYVDGVEDVVMDDNGLNLNNNGPLEIAKWANELSGGSIFNGSIDEVQLFNRALKAAEVLDNFHAVPGIAWPVSVTKSGSGTVTTNVSPGTLSWSDNTGTASYPDSTSLRLTAIPENGSGFGSWGGDCSGTDTSCSLSMFNGHTASASFFVNDYVRLGALTTPYGTLNHAYAAAHPGDHIKGLGRVFTEDLTLDRNLSVTLQGGYVAGFGSRSGSTTLSGRLTISSGSLVVDQLIIRGTISE